MVPANGKDGGRIRPVDDQHRHNFDAGSPRMTMGRSTAHANG